MTASDVVVGAAAPAVKVRLASFALNGHVRLGLGAVIYLVEAEGRFVRTADLYAKRSECPQSAVASTGRRNTLIFRKRWSVFYEVSSQDLLFG
jgi:hypothetical protein